MLLVDAAGSGGVGPTGPTDCPIDEKRVQRSVSAIFDEVQRVTMGVPKGQGATFRRNITQIVRLAVLSEAWDTRQTTLQFLASDEAQPHE